MKHFDHPNVLGLIGICLNTPDRVPYIVLQYMANGDLRTFLKNKRAGRTSVNQLPKVGGGEDHRGWGHCYNDGVVGSVVVCAVMMVSLVVGANDKITTSSLDCTCVVAAFLSRVCR